MESLGDQGLIELARTRKVYDMGKDKVEATRGEEVGGVSADRLAEIRNRHIGFVFQNFNLLPQLTASGNGELPPRFKVTQTKDRKCRAVGLFEQLGLPDRMSAACRRGPDLAEEMATPGS